MALNRDIALDNLTRIVQVIRNDRRLQEWFRSLANESVIKRGNEIYSMVERMNANGEEIDLVASFQLLADSRIFNGACEALGDSFNL